MSPRRLVLILLLLLWAVNGALLAWVKSAGPPPGPETRTLLKVFADKPAQAASIRKALDGAKLPVSALTNQPWKREVTEGFRAVLTHTDEELRKALFTGMRNKKLGVKIVGDEIQLGGVYKTKAEASKASASAGKQGFAFQVVENRVTKTTKTVLLKVGPLTEEERAQADEALDKLKLKPEQIEAEEVLTTPSPAPTP